MIAKRLLGIQKESSPPAPAATDVYYDYRSLILNMQGTAGSTTFTDESPNALTVTPYGDAQLVADATFGTVASFDGSGDYLSLAGNSSFQFGTGDYTVEAWIYINANASSQQTIVDTRGAASVIPLTVGLYQSSLMLYDGSVRQTSGITLTNNQWYHLAASRFNGVLKLFVNGTSYYSAANTVNISTGTSLIYLARGFDTSGYYFNGRIGPLRISPWAVYKSNFTPSQELFPAVQDSTYANPYYDKVALQLKFDGTNGSTSFVDTSPNAFAVTPNGNAQITSASKYGSGAGAFDGSGDYLAVASNAAFAFGSGDFTIEFWYYPKASLTNAGLVDLRWSASSSAGLLLRQGDGSSNGLSLTCWAGTAGSTTPATQTGLALNAWNHVAVVRSNSYLTAYINGVGGTSVLRSINLTDQNARIGAFINATGSPNCANGSIDELEITPGVAKYKANFTPPARGLSTIYNPYSTLPVSGAALWLDGADSSTLFTDAGVTPVSVAGDLVYQWSDKSGNNRHATQATSANRPTWVPPASGQNGFGAVGFDPVNYKYLLLSDFASTYKTFFIVHKGVSSSLDTRLFTVNSDYKVNVGAATNSGGNLSFVREYIAWTNSGFSRIYDATLFNLTYADSPTFSAKLEKYTSSGLTLIQSIALKGTGTNMQSFGQPGNYYEVVAFNRNLTASEILSMNSYLKDKWGTP